MRFFPSNPLKDAKSLLATALAFTMMKPTEAHHIETAVGATIGSVVAVVLCAAACVYFGRRRAAARQALFDTVNESIEPSSNPDYQKLGDVEQGSGNTRTAAPGM